MRVQFRKPKLKKQYEDFREAKKAYGEQVGRRYIQRINIIKCAKDIEELRRLPGLRCHELTGDRLGEWSITLVGRYRLIFTLVGDNLEIVNIEEVSKHYGD